MICLAVRRLAFEVFYDWGYPDGVEPHGLNVIEVGGYPFVRATAVFSTSSVARHRPVVGRRESVGHKLVPGNSSSTILSFVFILRTW